MPLLGIVAVIAVAFACSLALTRWALILAVRWQVFEIPRAGRIHAKKVPNLGWIGIFGGWIAPLALLAAVTLGCRMAGVFSNPYLEGSLGKMPMMAGIVAGAALSLWAGWWDDRKRIKPISKLWTQVALALLLCAFGLRILLPVSGALSVAGTILWMVCVTNAINLLDNLDGACGGVAFLSCAIFLCVALLLKQYFIGVLLAAFLGALGGFLHFNFPPAKIFMGNAGSSLVGYLLGVLTILETSYSKRSPSHLAMIMPFLLLAVPIYDTASVLLIRLRSGAPIYVGDTNHFAHRLLRAGKTTREALGIICLITLAAGMGAIFLPFVGKGAAMLILAATFAFLCCIALWESRRR